MKFDSKLLLEQLIRTHILEQQVVIDTNVKRGKPGSQTIYGQIDNPTNVSSYDKQFFADVNRIEKTSNKTHRPYIKLFSNVTRDGSVSESERLQSLSSVALKEAANLIDKYSEDPVGNKNNYSAIISNPQQAQGKQATESDSVTYDPAGKLYYTVVFISNSDINTKIQPKWSSIGGMKFYAAEQIDSLKPVVAAAADLDSDDKSKITQDTSTPDKLKLTPEQLSNQFITKKSQLANLGNSGEIAKNLQRAMYTFGMKETSGNLKNFPEFKSFINASWNTSRVPGDWDGEIGTRSRDLIDILKAGFVVTSDADLYTKLQAAINEIQPNLSESKLYKLTEQAGFDIGKAKDATSNKQRVVKKDDSSSSTRTTTTKNAWKCVLAAAAAASKISVNGDVKESTSTIFDANWIAQNQKNIDYVTFNQNNKQYIYYPDGTGFLNDIYNKKQYDCEDGVLKYFTAQVNKQDFNYQAKVIQRANAAGIPIDGKSISRLIYEAALFLKDFWAGDDLNKYTYPWYQPFTGGEGFKLSDWRDSYTAWGLGFDAPDPAVVENYDSAVDEMIILLVKQINQMRNTEFYGIMDALYNNISAGEFAQLTTLKQLQRDVTTQAGDEIFNQVDSGQFKIVKFSKDSETHQFDANVFNEKPLIIKKRVSIDYE
jgi:hypothetical protein